MSFYHFLRIIKMKAFFCQQLFIALTGGVLLGVLAIATGLIDLLPISKDKKPAMGTALTHGFMNAMIVIFFGIFAYRAWQLYPQLNMPLVSTLIVKAVLIVILFIGNYLGGKLILKYHIGVKKIGD